MAVKFFGQYLIEKGVVSREAIVAAINLQEQRNLKLGEMAMAMGYVTPADIERAHRSQYSRDLKLGDLLVSMGILTPEQLHEVVARQKETHLYIGEALVQIGALTPQQLQQQLGFFKIDQAPYITGTFLLPHGIAIAKTWEIAFDLTCKMVTRILGLKFRMGECTLVDRIEHNHLIAALDIRGDVRARYLVSVSAALRDLVAKAMLQEESVEGEPEEVLEDSLLEFINVVCGNVAAKASQAGEAIAIAPPEAIRPPVEGLPVPAGHLAVYFPLHLAEGEILGSYLLIPDMAETADAGSEGSVRLRSGIYEMTPPSC